MSVTDTVALVAEYVESIEGIATVKVGMPNENQPGGYDEETYPLAVLLAPLNFNYIRAGMGIEGRGFIEYDIRMTVYFGSTEAAQDAVIARATPLVDRVREKFIPDWKLGGEVFNTEITGPADNLDVYRDAKQPPVCQWSIHVTEERNVNALAA